MKRILPPSGANGAPSIALNGAHANYSPHTNGTATAPKSGPVWKFLTATRANGFNGAFRTIRDKFPAFDLRDAPGVDGAAGLLWRLRCEHDQRAFLDGRPLDDVVADALRFMADADDDAREALEWLCDEGHTTYKLSEAPEVAARLVKGWSEPVNRGTLAIPTTPPRSDEWGEALPLKNALLPVPALLPVLVPEPLRAWVFDCAERIGVAPDYLAVSSLVALASLVGNTVSIRPKQHDDWRVVPNLWGAVVGSPSVKKSPAIAESLKPLARLKALELERHRATMKDWEADALLNELDADALKSELKRRQKAGASRDELKAFIEQAGAGENAKPVLKTYSVQDATIEALTGVLARNPRGFLIERDELTGWLRALDKQGHEQDRAFFLEAFSGTKRNDQIERIGRGTLIVPHYVLSILGTIQPQPFAQLIRAASSGAGADGFVARFQMLVYPDALPQYLHVDRWPDKDAKNRAFGIFEALDNLTPDGAGAQLDDDGEAHFLRFDGAAQEIFDEWIINLENRLPQQSPLIEQHLAKYRSLMPSLALLFHLVSVADGSVAAGSIGEGGAMLAAEWCEFLEAHARRIYSLAGDGATDGAELIAARFGSLPNPFTLREVHQKRWMGLASRDDVESALARLEDRGWIRPQHDGGETGRPTLRHWKHPIKAGEK